MTAEEAAGVANPGSPRRPCLRTSGGRGGAPGEAAHAAAGAEPGGRGLASGSVPDAAEGWVAVLIRVRGWKGAKWRAWSEGPGTLEKQLLTRSPSGRWPRALLDLRRGGAVVARMRESGRACGARLGKT